MKLARHLLVISTMIAISISVYIRTPSHQWDPDELNLDDSERVVSVESSRRTHLLAIKTSSNVKGTAPAWKDQLLVKRTEDGRILDGLNEFLDDEDNLGPGPGRPTVQEAKEVLSAEEFETFLEGWQGYKEYTRAYYLIRKAKRKNREPTAEEIKARELSRPKLAPYQRMLRLVEKRLLESGKARPETVAQVEKRRSEPNRARKRAYAKARYEDKKAKRKALETRIRSGQATEQDRKEWAELEEEHQTYNERQRTKKAERKLTQNPYDPQSDKGKARADSKARYDAVKAWAERLKARVDSGEATDQEVKDWKEWEAKREADNRKRREERKSKKAKKAPIEMEGGKGMQDPQDETSKAQSDDLLSPLRGMISDKLQSKGINHLSNNPPFNGPHHFMESFRNRLQAIPWSSYLPRPPPQNFPNGLGAISGSTWNRPIYPSWPVIP